MNAIPEGPPAASHSRSFLWRLVVYFHLVGAGFWWWLMPGGFPILHLRFWANEVLPLVAIIVCLGCLWGERRNNASLRAATAVTIPSFWLAALVVAVVLFPQSARRFLLPASAGLMALGALFWLAFRRQTLPLRRGALAVIPAAAVAAGFVGAQRGGEPDTTPLNVTLPEFEPNVEQRLAAVPIRLSEGVDVLTTLGSITLYRRVVEERSSGMAASPDALARNPEIANRIYRVEIEPLLSFDSGSPDRFWTIVAPKAYGKSPPRSLVALRRDAGSLLAKYHDDADAVLHVTHSERGDELTCVATTRLQRPVYSHLNSFVALTISGCRKPALSFSPCPEILVDVEPADYPIGRPLRLAYLEQAEWFHVVRAKSGEKGPFTEFGRGHLPRAAPFSMTLFDGATAIVQLTLDDWAAQAGRSLSPTAGWGLPVNAIEFRQTGDPDSGSPSIAIWVTLAGTSVGRGWDSVGHAAGTYRNRMRIEWLIP